MWFQPLRIISQCTTFSQVVIHTMTLNIRFIVNIKAILVTQFIETSVLRIMTQTYSVQVMLFHQLEIFSHKFLIYVMPCFRIMLMNIYSTQLDRLTINQQHSIIHAVGRFLVYFLYLNPSETDIKRYHFCYLSVLLYSHKHFIKVRSFRRPCLYLWDFLIKDHCILFL